MDCQAAIFCNLRLDPAVQSTDGREHNVPKKSDYQTLADAWLKQFGSPMPIAGELETAWQILKESGVNLPPPQPPKPKKDPVD